ncbi:MAG: hypothetical protein ACYTGN_10275 [Planctomycetota bacterium]|jgi:hypothetical protein
MSLRGITLLALVAALAGGCVSEDEDPLLSPLEFAFLGEDVIDMTAAVFEGADRAFYGDIVDAGDVIEPPDEANDYTVRYELPPDLRDNIGLGFGTVTLQILEDGVPVQTPLQFTYADSTADEVRVFYKIVYRGEATLTARLLDIDLDIDLIVSRSRGGELELGDYVIDGFVDLGPTGTSISTDFRAFGSPRDGIVDDGGGADTIIDDPDVFDVYEGILEFFDDEFRADGSVGCCTAYFDRFFYDEVGLGG